jgi:iron complex outermembrane receptor protein
MALTGNYYYTSKFPFDTAGQYYQGGYGLLNLRAAWTAPSSKWNLAVYATNALDKRYNTQVLPGLPAIQRVYGEPAIVGVSVGVKF